MKWHWKIRNFRNLDIDFEVEAERILIAGPNASGKTSLLEAFYWLAYGRSFRTRRIDRIVRYGEREALIRVEWPDIQETIEARVGSGGQLRYQGKPISYAEWRERWPVFYVGGRVGMLMASRVAWRRKFLDDSLLAIFPRYQRWRLRYRQAWQQRNQALEEGWDDAARAAWDEAFAQSGARLWEARLYLIRQIQRRLQEQWQAFFPDEPIQVRLTTAHVSEWSEDLLQVFHRALADAISEEKEQGHSLVGPHRDDLTVATPQGLLWETASTGQLRLFQVVWALALADLVMRLRGVPLLLLLDDFDAEVDTPRCRRLFPLIASHRAILTTHRKYWTRPGEFPGDRCEIRQGQLFRIVP